jgi:hypothetical protein
MIAVNLKLVWLCTKYEIARWRPRAAATRSSTGISPLIAAVDGWPRM